MQLPTKKEIKYPVWITFDSERNVIDAETLEAIINSCLPYAHVTVGRGRLTTE